MPTDDIITIALELSRHLRRKMTCEWKGKHEINYLRTYALSFIKENENVTMSAFADGMKISASSASAFVDRLCKEDWVKRKADAKNRKVVHLQLTPAGDKILLHNSQEKRRFLTDILKLIPPADRKHLARILKNLQQSFDTPSH